MEITTAHNMHLSRSKSPRAPVLNINGKNMRPKRVKPVAPGDKKVSQRKFMIDNTPDSRVTNSTCVTGLILISFDTILRGSVQQKGIV